MGRMPKPHYRSAPRVAGPPPETPENLGDAGLEAWRFIWSHSWVVPARHRLLVERYCRLRDLLQTALDQVAADGLMVEGSRGQRRVHPATVEVRALSHECRLIEGELGLSPASEARAGVPAQPTPGALEAAMASGGRPDDDDDDDDPRRHLMSVSVTQDAGKRNADRNGCDGCGARLQGNGRARYCSAACRQRAFRERQNEVS